MNKNAPIIALMASQTSEQVAMMAAQPFAQADGEAKAPAWVHLLPAPADGLVRTADNRGPYTMAPFAEIIQNTFSTRNAIEVDINHATYLAAPKGGEAPAVGWIKEMQARDDGLWGRVEWTEEGEKLVAGRAYRGISPVLMHASQTDKKITRLANASLVNQPNLKGLATLHQQQETVMNFMQRLAKMVGLNDDATEDEIAAAVEKYIKGDGAAKPDADTVAMQSAITSIGTALGVAGGDHAAIIAAAQAAKTAQPTEIAALQSEITGLTETVKTLKADGAREKATAFVEGAIKDGRVGLPPALSERYITMHMADPAGTAQLIEAMPTMSPSGTTINPPKAKDGVISLNAEQSQVAAQLGMSEKEFADAVAEEQEAK